MMPARRLPIALAWAAVTAASLGVGLFIVTDTIRMAVSLHSALPWLDDWNTVDLFQRWSSGDLPLVTALLSQFGEHRLAIPRLVFFADDLYGRGQGWLDLVAILSTQVVHAALFAVVLARVRSLGPGRWAVAGSVTVLLFSLQQAANFTTAFQLQFVLVFAAATAAFVLFGRAAVRVEAALPTGGTFAASLGAAAVSTFCMANGLLCGLVLVVLTVLARMRKRVVASFALVWVVLALIYLIGYTPADDHTPPAEALLRPGEMALYAASYLGSLAGGRNPQGAIALGFLGVVATAGAAVLVGRRRVPPEAGLALLGVMLFCGGSAVITAAGRLNFGSAQALDQRYATASATFWSAQLCFWWVAWPGRLPRVAVAALCCWLAVVALGIQSSSKPQLFREKLDRNYVTDLLLLGLDDPALVLRTAWGDDDVQNHLPFLRRRGISIFGGPEGQLLDRPLGDLDRAGSSTGCSGTIREALADPGLGKGGVRVEGEAWDDAEHLKLHRILLVDPKDKVVGLATSGLPGGKPADWRGFAVAPPGENLRAFGWRGAGRVCSLGRAGTAVVQ